MFLLEVYRDNLTLISNNVTLAEIREQSKIYFLHNLEMFTPLYVFSELRLTRLQKRL
jgi:hypothetical protein